MTFPIKASIGRMLLWCVACVFLSAVSTFAAAISGRVTSVLDGDTIEVLHNGRAERIRLSSIDCPEKGQAYGKQ